jgi:UDP-glucose 4-epimerase
MKVLITGGAGFIGANLARRLVERGDTVVALDDLSTGRRANLRDHERLTFIRGSILDAGALDVAAQGVDAIVHLAAKASVPESVRDPISSHAVNVAGTIEVLEAARRAGAPHVVLASSSSVYGNDPTPKKHERISPRPLSPYAASKAATEAYAEAYHYSYDIPVLTFRFFNVFGPLQPANHVYAAVIPAFVAATVAGQPLTMHGDGKQTRDFTSIDSLTAVIADGLQRRVISPAPVNLAFGAKMSLLDLVVYLEDISGRALPVHHVEARAGDVRHSSADCTQLRELFPDVEPTPFGTSLRATYDWFRGGCR